MSFTLPERDTRVPLVAGGAAKKKEEQQRLRRLSQFYGEGKGSNTNSHDALRMQQAVVFQCRKCGGLTDYLSARRARQKAAKRVGFRAGSDRFAASDGCYNRGCSSFHRSGSFAVTQAARREGILALERVLIRPPKRLTDREVTVIGRAAAFRVAEGSE